MGGVERRFCLLLALCQLIAVIAENILCAEENADENNNAAEKENEEMRQIQLHDGLVLDNSHDR